MGVVTLKIAPSEYTRGSVVGIAGEDLPYDVSLESDFALGWHFGRDMRIEAPKASIITHEDHYQSKYDDLPLTWPEGREGAAAMIPTHRVSPLPALYKDDVAAIRDMGGPAETTEVAWGICDDPLGR
jgi:hypothetical protein